MKLTIFRNTAIAIIGLFSVVWLASPSIFFHLLNKQLQPYQLQLSEPTSIRLNLFNASVNINDFALKHKSITLVELGQAKLNLNVIDLLLLQLEIEQLKLTELSLDIQQSAEGIALSGIPLNRLLPSENTTSSGTNTREPSTTTPQSSGNTDALTPLPILANNIELLSSNITFSQLNDSQSVVQKHQIELDNIRLSSLLVKGNDIHFLLDIELLYHLHLLQDTHQQTKVSSQLKIAGEQRLTLKPHQLDVKLKPFTILMTNTQVLKDGWQAQLTEFDLEISNLELTQQDQVLNLTGLVNTSLSELTAAPVGSSQQSVNLQSININDIALFTADQKLHLEIPAVELNQLILMADNTGKRPELLNVESLTINNILASETGVSVNKISFNKVYSNILINPNKQLANLYLPAFPPKKAEQTQTETIHDQINQQERPEPATSTDFAIQINQVVKQNDMVIHFHDTSINPEYKTTITIDKLAVSEINNQRQELITQVDVSGGINGFTRFALASKHQPFLPQQVHNIQFNISELSLQELSPYVRDALQYDINNGQLNSEVELTLVGENLNGDIDLLLQNLDLSAIDDQGEQETISGGTISFNYALGMLEDSNGQVVLNVPIDGDIKDPNIGFSGFLSLMVKQATLSAAKDYLITTFVPYAKVAKIAMSVGEHLLRLTFNPLDFAAGQTEINKAQQEYLHQLAFVLAKHSDVKVTLCPVATHADIPTFANQTELTEKEVAQLTALATVRSKNVKTWLVEQENIASSRLLLCAAQVEPESNARVEFSQL